MNKVHHIGIATNDLEKLKSEYFDLGFHLVDEIYDDIQKAKLTLLVKDKEVVELISTNDCSSSVYKTCFNNYKKEYHICYLVDSLNDEINKYKSEGAILIKDVCFAPLLNSNICFIYTKNGKVIELVEDNGKVSCL